MNDLSPFHSQQYLIAQPYGSQRNSQRDFGAKKGPNGLVNFSEGDRF
jgi:hypothetical protein